MQNGNRPPQTYGNFRMPSVEERKQPRTAPQATQNPRPQTYADSAEPETPVKQPRRQSAELPNENTDLPYPAAGYYPLAGRQKSAYHVSDSSDIEAYSLLILLTIMLCLTLFVLFAYSGYVFSKATGPCLNITAAAAEKASAADGVFPLMESDYFGEGGSDITPVDPNGPYDFSSSVPVSAAVDDAWFSDAVFIGDSRTEGLWLYSKIKSNYICERGLNLNKFFSDTLAKYDGKTAFAELKALDVTKIYICFGINEIGWYGDSFIKAYSSMIDEVRAAKPDAVIYVQNIFPMTKELSDKNVYGNNNKIREYNRQISELCLEKKVYMLDIYSYFADSNGNLKDSYETGVDGAHFKAGGQGYLDWASYIRTHIAQK